MAVQGNASEPKSWQLQSSRKKSTVADEDILLLQAMQDTLLASKMDADYASAECEESEDGGGYCNELLDELELREVSILQRMAQKRASPTQLREKVRRLNWTAEVESGNRSTQHRQSKLKNLRWSLKKSDKLHSSTGSQRLWVDVDEAGCPTGCYRSDWLPRLRGYSRDLD